LTSDSTHVCLPVPRRNDDIGRCMAPLCCSNCSKDLHSISIVSMQLRRDRPAGSVTPPRLAAASFSCSSRCVCAAPMLRRLPGVHQVFSAVRSDSIHVACAYSRKVSSIHKNALRGVDPRTLLRYQCDGGRSFAATGSGERVFSRAD